MRKSYADAPAPRSGARNRPHYASTRVAEQSVTAETREARRRARRQRERRVRLAIAAAAVAAAGAGVVLGVVLTGSGGGERQSVGISPVIVSPAGLRTLAGAVPEPIYWAGRVAGRSIELSRSADGKVYVRYLPQGVAAGAADPYLTVATYPYANAFQAIQGLARQPGAETVRLPLGGLAVIDASNPTNIHLAFPGSSYEVEVFAPAAAEARRVVAAGRVAPVVGRPR
jgi:hypothetical protein